MAVKAYQNPETVSRIVGLVREQLAQSGAPAITPRIAIIAGTGLGDLAGLVESPVTVPYSALPGFPQSTVLSHAGQFLFGTIASVPVVIQQGRCHLYEGYSPDEVCCGVRVMAGLGAGSLFITNAAGALVPEWDTGGLMLITDHINWTGTSPLIGPNHDEWGPRFPGMVDTYDPEYRRLALEAATRLNIRLERGVYIGLNGPQMESPAETRLYRQIGAQAVGMSTVLEVIAARHLGMRILGISCLTNKNLPDCMADAPIEEVIRVAKLAGDALTRLVADLVGQI